MSTDTIMGFGYFGPILCIIFCRLVWYVLFSAPDASFMPKAKEPSMQEWQDHETMGFVVLWPAMVILVLLVAVSYYSFVLPVAAITKLRNWRLNRSKKSNITHYS